MNFKKQKLVVELNMDELLSKMWHEIRARKKYRQRKKLKQKEGERIETKNLNYGNNVNGLKEKETIK